MANRVTLTLRLTAGKSPLKVTAHTTPIGGLVVAPTYEILWHYGAEHPIRRQNRWAIYLYPVGLSALSGFWDKQQAIDFAVANLTKYSWVGLLKEDIQKANDMDAMREDFIRFAKRVEDMRKCGKITRD